MQTLVRPAINLAPFALSKGMAAIYEGIALEKITQWYALQGKRVHVRYNEENGLDAKRAYDLIDTYGIRWEVKADRIWGTTGKVFIEHQAVAHSQADMFIILAGWAYLVPRKKLVDLLNEPHPVHAGGDGGRAEGLLLPLSTLSSISIIV